MLLIFYLYYWFIMWIEWGYKSRFVPDVTRDIVYDILMRMLEPKKKLEKIFS